MPFAQVQFVNQPVRQLLTNARIRRIEWSAFVHIIENLFQQTGMLCVHIFHALQSFDQASRQFHSVHDLDVIEQIPLARMLARILKHTWDNVHVATALFQQIQQADCVAIGVPFIAQRIQQNQTKGILEGRPFVGDQFSDPLQLCRMIGTT